MKQLQRERRKVFEKMYWKLGECFVINKEFLEPQTDNQDPIKRSNLFRKGVK